MDRFLLWTVQVCALCSVIVLPAVHSITVSMDDFKYCNGNPYYTLEDNEELIILSKGNKSKSLLGEIIGGVISLEVSYCNIQVSPKRSSSKQYMQAVYETLNITDCKVKVTVRESTPSGNRVNVLSEVTCKSTKPDTMFTTKDKNSIKVVLNKDVDPSNGYDFRIKISLWEGPDTSGLSFAVKLVIGIACGIAVLIIIVLVVKTVLYKRRVKKEEGDEDVPESLPMRSANTEAERNGMNEKEMYISQDRNSPSPKDNIVPPPSYNDLYDK